MTTTGTSSKIVEAARECLLSGGYAGLSTRKVAEAAGVPLSQIHYHFGNKQQLILSLLQAESDRLIERQTSMFAEDLPISKQWEIACDYLDEDIESGYVRVLHEMMAAGWSSEAVRNHIREMLGQWAVVLTDFARRAELSGASPDILSTQEAAALIAAVFIGAETMILNGQEDGSTPIRKALRSIGRLLAAEEGATS